MAPARMPWWGDPKSWQESKSGHASGDIQHQGQVYSSSQITAMEGYPLSYLREFSGEPQAETQCCGQQKRSGNACQGCRICVPPMGILRFWLGMLPLACDRLGEWALSVRGTGIMRAGSRKWDLTGEAFLSFYFISYALVTVPHSQSWMVQGKKKKRWRNKHEPMGV